MENSISLGLITKYTHKLDLIDQKQLFCTKNGQTSIEKILQRNVNRDIIKSLEKIYTRLYMTKSMKIGKRPLSLSKSHIFHKTLDTKIHMQNFN